VLSGTLVFIPIRLSNVVVPALVIALISLAYLGREIWEENGQPAGRDEEFWFQAERKFREAENLAKEASEDV
jgi:Protein of unknown function (DUF2934)